ncbi:YceI family protein [soil metagenome]
MKNLNITFTLFFIAIFMNLNFAHAAGNPEVGEIAEVVELKADAAKSKVNWTATKVGGEHTGTVKLANGILKVEGNKLKGGSFDMDMTTIQDTDITNASMNEKLTNHLRSEDFFSVEKNPTSTFKITKAEPIANAKAGSPNYNITGDLTIKGITNPVSFPGTVKISGDMAEASAKVEVNRIKWDIKYRSGLLGTAADKIIYDNFTIDFNIVAGKSVAAK